MAYAAINKEELIRFASSSGGIFTLLAVQVIKSGGIVFGAVFSDDCKSVFHMAVETIEGLKKLRGSKYVQSRIGDTYRQAAMYLDTGRLVLFSGTPCQIAGLYAYLKHDYKNLITQDLICHGVPSPLVWEKYVELREKKAASKTKSVSFRYKKHGWNSFSMRFIFNNGAEYVKHHNEDRYMRGFLANLYLRPSCYNCAFKGFPRQSDITLADFWGIQYIIPDMDDDKGTSLVIVNSDKGKSLFKQIQTYLIFRPVNWEQAIVYNSAAIKSAQFSKQRDTFFGLMNEKGLNNAFNKYCRTKFMAWIKRKIHMQLSKIKLRITGEQK